MNSQTPAKFDWLRIQKESLQCCENWVWQEVAVLGVYKKDKTSEAEKILHYIIIILNGKQSPTFSLLVLLFFGSVIGVLAKHFLTNAGGVEFF